MKVTQAQLQSFLLGGVVVGFVVNVLSGTWKGHEWFWGTLGALVVLAVYLIPKDGFLRRHRYGRTPGIQLLAVLLVIAYPIAVWWLSRSDQFFAFLAPAVILWLASSLLLWTSSEAAFGEVAFASGNVLASLPLLLGGVVVIRDGWPPFGMTLLLGRVPLLLSGVALLLSGVALLMFGVPFLLAGVDPRNQRQPITVTLLLFGIAFLLCSVAVLMGGRLLFAVALLFAGEAFILCGLAFSRERWPMFGVALLLGGLAFMLGGLAFLRGGQPLYGVVNMLLGLAVLLGGMAFLRGWRRLFSLVLLLGGVGALLLGVAVLRNGQPLFGVALLLLGMAFLLSEIGPLREMGLPRLVGRFWAWLASRPTQPPAVGPGDQENPS